VNWARLKGESVPEAEAAPVFSMKSYPQVYPQPGQGVWITADRQERTPPVAKSTDYLTCTPQQKIFAKVKAAIWPLTCGFIYCDVLHIVKTRNALNFLPYI
jgi:hypothetical protein